MPRIKSDDDMQQHQVGNNFSFTAVKIDHLGATSYTLVNIMIDATGSVVAFAPLLRQMLQTTIAACKKSPQSDNVLVRACTFNQQGVVELHGFRPLADIDPAAYPEIVPMGLTPLYDAVYSAIGSTLVYAEKLAAAEYGCNGLVVVITDGFDNLSKVGTDMIATESERATRGEKLESLVSILVGINDPRSPDPSVSRKLADFQKEARLTHYVDAGAATPGKMAKLAAFVSQSVSSQSQAVGTGGPSQNIDPTI